MKSILAVDDSPVILSLIKDILSNHDYKVETAEDGQEALEKYVKFKPHVVTLDLAMPSDVKHISYSDIMIPSEEQVSFLTEINGQQIGMVISFIKKSDLKVLFGDSPDDSMESSKAKEFFNILNTKVLSQLADATHLNLKTRPTVYFKKPKEKEHFWRSASSMWDQTARASFKANYDGHAIPIDIQLWYDGGRIFT